MEEILFLPEHASNFAWQVDTIYLVLIGLSAIFTLPIVGLIIYFAVKYRRSSTAERARSHTNYPLEWLWIGGLLALVVPVFLWSSNIFFSMFRPPAGALEIFVVGEQWMWKFQHPTGQREINQLHVPIGRPVKLLMTSQDVIHSFYVPAFRVKHDVIPGRYTTLWFEATKTGTYHLFCAEYCGTEHSGMVGQVIVMEPAEYQAWLSTGGQAAAAPAPTPESLVEAGRLLFEQRGCASCHRADGTGPGPALVGVFGSQVRLENGQTVVADESYIRESIVNPNAKVVAGYQPIMPSFQGQLSEEELNQLVAYIRSLGQGGAPAGTPAPGTTPGAAPGGATGTAAPTATGTP